MDRPVAESQLATTPSQQQAMSHPGLQTHLGLNPQQRGTPDPELSEDLEGCTPFSAPAHFRSGGSLQNLKHATQECPASIDGHGQNASRPDSVARYHEGHALTPRHPFDRPDNRNDSVCQLHR